MIYGIHWSRARKIAAFVNAVRRASCLFSVKHYYVNERRNISVKIIAHVIHWQWKIVLYLRCMSVWPFVHWDCVFESHSGYRQMVGFVLSSCQHLQTDAFQWADLRHKESISEPSMLKENVKLPMCLIFWEPIPFRYMRKWRYSSSYSWIRL
jgi:hypothetical protein